MSQSSLTTKAISSAFGIISGLTLLILLLAIPMLAMSPLMVFADRLGDLSSLTFLVVLGLSVALGSATGFLPAIALARFALRVWPINASSVPRKGCIVWQRRLAYTSASVLILATVSIVFQRILGEGLFHSNNVPAEGRGFVFAMVAGWAAWGVTVVAGAALSSWVHSHPSYFLRRRFILYLRHFSGFADRTIISEVLKAAPPTAPVVFIASPQSQPRNWDPFVWAFSGLRLRYPLGSLPVQLRTPDEGWEPAIARLISEATTVVMDLSESSASVEEEIRLVAQHAKPERALWLVDRGSKPSPHTGVPTGLQIEPSQVVAYQRRWAFLALAMKTLVFAFVGYLIYQWTVAIPAMERGYNEIRWTQLLWAIVLLSVWVSVGAVLLTRPSINREARRSLRQRLAVVDMVRHGAKDSQRSANTAL